MAGTPLAVLAFLSLTALPALAEDFAMPRFKFTKSADAPAADAKKDAEGVLKRQYDYMNSAYGGKVPQAQAAELKNKLDWLGACEDDAFKSGKDNPDCGSSAWTCTGDMYEKMTFGQGATSADSNAGMIRYMRKSIMTDPVLFGTSFLFYKRLKEQGDLGGGAPPPGDGRGASIKRKASADLFKVAQSVVKEATGKSDPFLAMKTLTVYGHDNMKNCVSCGASRKSCQLVLLDSIRPATNSNLYLDGAIGMSLWEDDVKKGDEILKACHKAAEGRTVEYGMCGDSYSEYQADYYHVVTSAFLHCHCLARGSSIIDSMSAGLQKDAYLFMVAKYKINRIEEYIKDGLKNPGHTPAVRLLETAFKDKFGLGANGWKVTCDSAKASTCLERAKIDDWPWASWCSEAAMQGNCREGDIKAAKALMSRYVFEVNFRVSQHFSGILAANAYCRSSTLDHGACR